MGDNITFSDWSERLENGGSNHWLPAYGFQNPRNIQDRQFEIINDDTSSQQNFCFLETILEETSDDLQSESDYSGPTGWPDSDSDTSSVIHIAERLNATLRNNDWGGSERDLVVPKKRRRRQIINTDPGVHDDDDENDDDDDLSVPMSRSSSLLQFENLEKQCETVFKTSATSEPFAMTSNNHSNNYHWRFSSDDSLDDNRSTSSSSNDNLSRSYSSRSLKSNNSGLKSYRSFDSLTMGQNLQSDKTQTLLLSQSLSNNALHIEPEVTEPIPTPRGMYKTVECLTEMSCQHSNKSQETVRTKRSAENLSEDSGFGDHTSTMFHNADYSSFSLLNTDTDTDKKQDINIEVQENETGGDIINEERVEIDERDNSDLKIEEVQEEGENDESKFSCGWQSALHLDFSSIQQAELEQLPNMTSRLPNLSTPNLHNFDDEFLNNDCIYYTDSVPSLSKSISLKRINFESESDITASRQSVCSSKSVRAQITTSFINLNTVGQNSASGKGVHFSPVVSEVMWKDNATATASTTATDQNDKISKDYSPSSVKTFMNKLFDYEEENYAKEENEGHVYDSASTNEENNISETVIPQPLLSTMDSYHPGEVTIDKQDNKSPSKNISKFFQRFSFKRLSGRSGDQKKKEDKKNGVKKFENNFTTEKIININNGEEDFKIIPLHPPENITEKPPLPPSLRRQKDARSGGVSNFVYPHAQNISSMSVSRMDSIDQNEVGLLETDIDSEITTKKAQSLLNLDNERKTNKKPSTTLTTHTDYRAKSMEFLLDKENQAAVKAPENELRKERVLSEHELRFQRSLQKLNVPDWYKNHAVPSQGFLLKRNSDAGVQNNSHNHWPGLSSKTTSLSSLGSGYSNPAIRNSPERATIVSPCPTPQILSRWSTSKLNSATTSSSTSPSGSARSSFNYRQPYLGWRYSQERLSKPRTPAERLAASILQNSSTTNLNEVRTSIKEVTSAIESYVSARDSGDKLNTSSRFLHGSSTSLSRSTSPRGSTGKVEKCWLESSFIGCKPIETSMSTQSPIKSTSTMPSSKCLINSSNNSSITSINKNININNNNINNIKGCGNTNNGEPTMP